MHGQVGKWVGVDYGAAITHDLRIILQLMI